MVNEADLVTRARLLGFYSRKGQKKIDRQFEADARLKHIMWFIENAPDCKFGGDTYFAVDRKAHARQYAQVKAAWSKQIADTPDRRQIAINAALFTFKYEPQHSKELATSVLHAMPENAWAKRLMHKIVPGKTDSGIQVKSPKAPHGFDFGHWQLYTDNLYPSRVISHGSRMPPISAHTLERVLAKYPFDIIARAELIGFYGERWQRANVLQVDPQYLEALIRHYLWCIEYIPGSSLTWHAVECFDKKKAPDVHRLLLRAWSEKVKDCLDNAAILAEAAHFYSKCGRRRRSEALAERARKLGNTGFILYHDTADLRPKVSVTEQAQALKNISVHTKAPKPVSRFSDYNFAEWASEVDLSGAHLEGVFHWVPSTSIANLDDVLTHASIDIYNRAKIIGSYDNYYSPRQDPDTKELTAAQKESHLQHKIWFIENIPESRFVGTFRLYMHEKESYEKLLDAFLNQANKRLHNLDAVINVAAALAYADKKQSLKLAKFLLKEHRKWGQRILILLGQAIPDPDVKAALRDHSFKPAERKITLTRTAKTIDLTRLAMYGSSLPNRTLWSNERALEYNPNDLLLRAELLEGYDARDQFSVSFCGHTPDVAHALLKHNLWFIQNIPDYYLYSTGCELSIQARPDYSLGDHAILLEAAKRQMRAYPTNLAVGLALHHYYPLGRERAAIAVLQTLKKLYPTNKLLEERLVHLRSLISTRRRRKMRAD